MLDRRYPRRPRPLDARPLHGIYARDAVDAVAVGPFFEAGTTWSGDWTGRAAASEADGPHHRLRRRVCKEELVLSVATAVHSIPEADARKACDATPTETKSRYAKGDGRADIKETTVPQVASLPTPTTEAPPGPTKDVTVGDEGAVNVRLRLLSRILSLHPLRGR